jgi:metal-responsive CopG/Arc/MetJ family transcriptional regulator
MTINITLAFPEAMVKEIDNNRGDVNRSKFIVKLIEFAYQKKQEESDKKQLQQSEPRVSGSHAQTDEVVVNAQTAVESNFSNDR